MPILLAITLPSCCRPNNTVPPRATPGPSNSQSNLPLSLTSDSDLLKIQDFHKSHPDSLVVTFGSEYIHADTRQLIQSAPIILNGTQLLGFGRSGFDALIDRLKQLEPGTPVFVEVTFNRGSNENASLPPPYNYFEMPTWLPGGDPVHETGQDFLRRIAAEHHLKLHDTP